MNGNVYKSSDKQISVIKQCVKCGVQLSTSEIEVGKDKCVKCIVKGYKWYCGRLNSEIVELEMKVDKLERRLKKGD